VQKQPDTFQLNFPPLIPAGFVRRPHLDQIAPFFKQLTHFSLGQNATPQGRGSRRHAAGALSVILAEFLEETPGVGAGRALLRRFVSFVL